MSDRGKSMPGEARDTDMDDVGAGNTYEAEGESARRGDSQARSRENADAGVALAGDIVEENIGSYQEESGATTSPGGPAPAGDRPRRAENPESLPSKGAVGNRGYGLDTDESPPS